jgi:Golgi apparatus protein 1
VATLIEFTNADIHTDPVLHEACFLDLSKFCREVPQGNSQQLKCLALVCILRNLISAEVFLGQIFIQKHSQMRIRSFLD